LTDPAPGPDSIRKNTVFALAMRVVGAVFTGGLTLFLARRLGPGDYGVYALALSVAGLLALPADFGISRSAARFIAERRDNESEAAAAMRHALTLKAAGTGTMCILLIALAGPIARAYDVSSLETPLRIVAIAVLCQSFMLLFTAAFEAVGRNSLGFRLAAAESALEAFGSAGLVLAGAGVIGAASGRAAAYAVAALLGLLFATGLFGRQNLRRRTRSKLTIRTVAGYAGALFIVDSAFAAFGQIDNLLIGAILGAASAGIFNAPAQMVVVASYPGLALAGGISPRLARGKRGTPNTAAFRSGFRLLLLVQLVVVAPMVVWATPIIHLLLGSGYGESADVFRALTPYAVMMGPGALLALSINYLGEARRRVVLAILAVAINAAIDAVLIPRIGVVAGAIGTDVAFLVFAAGHLLIARTLLEFPLRPLGATFLRASLAAVAMCAVLWAFGTTRLTALDAVAGSILGISEYLAVLMVTREVTTSELRNVLEIALRTGRQLTSALRPSGPGGDAAV
jgi:O-antigen/teichoic acid export membrane protein